MPKYCKTCKLQRHNEKEYFVIYPKEEKEDNNKAEDNEEMTKKEKTIDKQHMKDGETQLKDDKEKSIQG